MRGFRVRVIVVVCGAMLAATAGVASPAGAKDAAGGVLGVAPNGVPMEGYASHPMVGVSADEVRRFWTPERMRNATPARPPVSVAGPRTAAVGAPASTEAAAPSVEAIEKALRAAGETASVAELLAVGSITAGKAFFIDPLDGREHYCSGATVNSVKRRLVVTAGHCVYNGFWMQGWAFAPAYDHGAPYGFWIAGNLAARTDWMYYGWASADVGIAIMGNDLSGRRIVDVVGGNGLAWNQPLGQRVDLFAYPFGESTQTRCAGATFTGIDTGTIGTAPCRFGPGGSGGAMLLHFGSLGAGRGYVASVAADVWSTQPGSVFGPYFENVNAGLFYYAESISP